MLHAACSEGACTHAGSSPAEQQPQQRSGLACAAALRGPHCRLEASVEQATAAASSPRTKPSAVLSCRLPVQMASWAHTTPSASHLTKGSQLVHTRMTQVRAPKCCAVSLHCSLRGTERRRSKQSAHHRQTVPAQGNCAVLAQFPCTAERRRKALKSSQHTMLGSQHTTGRPGEAAAHARAVVAAWEQRTCSRVPQDLIPESSKVYHTACWARNSLGWDSV